MKHILFIDDDKEFVKTMSACIDPMTYTVASAGDGVDGLKRVAEQMPDVIVLDINMPNMGGIEFMRKLNAMYGESKVPILIASNNSDMDIISEAVAMGARGYVVKANETSQGICKSIDTILK